MPARLGARQIFALCGPLESHNYFFTLLAVHTHLVRGVCLMVEATTRRVWCQKPTNECFGCIPTSREVGY
jgi:hypothetical protein